MKIKLHRNPATNQFGECSLTEGGTGDVPDDQGAALVAAGLAECLDPPVEIKAVPAKPAIAEAKEPVKKKQSAKE